MKLLVAILFFLVNLQCFGVTLPPEEAHLQKIAKDIEIAKQNLEIQEIKQRKTLSALFSINKNLQKLVREKTEQEQERGMLELQIQNLNSKIDENSKQVQQQKAQLAERLQAIYKLQGPTVARFLFAAKNSAALERNLKILGIVTKRDLQLIKDYKATIKDFEGKKEKLTQRLAYFQELEEKMKVHEARLQKELFQKNKILAGIRKNKMFTQEKLQQLKDKSLNYDLADSGLMDLIFKESFADQKGELPRPVQGPVVKKFGLIKTPDQSYVLSHKGLLISAKEGTAVKAVFAGKVSFVGSLPGMGKVLILDHGDHYYTVYGYTSEVKVQLGQDIKQSQVIALSGRSSFDQQSGLYFEVRHFSEPYNPMEWVKGFKL